VKKRLEEMNRLTAAMQIKTRGEGEKKLSGRGSGEAEYTRKRVAGKESDGIPHALRGGGAVMGRRQQNSPLGSDPGTGKSVRGGSPSRWSTDPEGSART